MIKLVQMLVTARAAIRGEKAMRGIIFIAAQLAINAADASTLLSSKVVLMGALVCMDYHAQNRSRSILTSILEIYKPTLSQKINPARTVFSVPAGFFLFTC